MSQPSSTMSPHQSERPMISRFSRLCHFFAFSGDGSTLSAERFRFHQYCINPPAIEVVSAMVINFDPSISPTLSQNIEGRHVYC